MPQPQSDPDRHDARQGPVFDSRRTARMKPRIVSWAVSALWTSYALAFLHAAIVIGDRWLLWPPRPVVLLRLPIPRNVLAVYGGGAAMVRVLAGCDPIQRIEMDLHGRRHRSLDTDAHVRHDSISFSGRRNSTSRSSFDSGWGIRMGGFRA